jgi:tRNA(Ile)-lysidine synthase
MPASSRSHIRVNREHIRTGDRVCVAVSGGADSTALLLLLHAENALPSHALGVGLSAVHVHHGLRGDEADEDLSFLEELCARLQVPLHVERASVPERLRAGANPSRAETLEEAARILRYAAFERLICTGRADSVLTAHTLDDQAETVLIKLLRGAWTEGLSGIYPVLTVSCPVGGPQGARHGKIVRPLLVVPRAELVAYLEQQGQGWRTDSSNTDDAFTRNRVRQHLLPMLRQYNPAIERTLANTADLARDEEIRWQAELARLLPQLLLPGRPVRGGGRAVGTSGGEESVSIELERLRALDRATLRRVLRAGAWQLRVRLTFGDTVRLEELVLAIPGKAGAKLHFSAGLAAQRSARELRLFRKVSSGPD